MAANPLSMPANPLLDDAFPIRFDLVLPENVGPAVDTLLRDTEDALARIETQSGPLDFDGTLGALERASERLERAMRIVGHLEGVATTPALRAVYTAAQPRVAELSSSIPLREGLWRVIERYAQSDEGRALEGARKRFLARTVARFRREGAELDLAGKERLKQIDVELSKLTLRYAQNVLDSTNAFELVVTDEQALAGLPDSARRAARESASQHGHERGWRFTLQYPSYAPALTHLDDATLRQRLFRAMTTRATSGEHDNRPLVARIVELRQQRAQLLGYASFADLVLEDRMAGSAARARAFVDDLHARTDASFRRENEELAAFRRELEGPDAPALEAWDVAYYGEKLRQARYRYDEEALRPYFGFARVLEGLFAIAGRLYGVRFEPWTEAPRWHDSVRAYKLLDEDGSWLAGIYVDAWPRESKQGGAWMDGILARARREADHRHIGVLAANVTPPIAGADAALRHDEVETMFHEFGHLMHHCFSRTELRSQAGTKVVWDFVELPSQIFENWCWERQALDLFARHADTGERLPDDLLLPMQRARTFRAASHQMRQLAFASIDLTLHTTWDVTRDGDPVAFARELLARFSPTSLPPEHALIASFEHLFADPVGYAAGYYSYKWAEVLDADAFRRFHREGLLERAVGDAFRRDVLERGDEEDPGVLFRRFMGRDPDLDALLERLGLRAA
jgi:oligopeptidase A